MVLGNWVAYPGVVCSVPFPAGARGAVRGKTSPGGTCKSLPVLQVCFLLFPRCTTGKFSSSVRRNPWISELLLRHPFKSGSVLQLRLHFKEVSVNRLRRQPGTKQSLLFRHNSAVSSPPQKPFTPRPSPGPPRAWLWGRDLSRARGHLHPPDLQVPRVWFCDSAGAAVAAPKPPVCSPSSG